MYGRTGRQSNRVDYHVTSSHSSIHRSICRRSHSQPRPSRIAAIVKRVGFKESLAGGAFEGQKDLEAYPELAVVSDADQLDAIGAIGACVNASGYNQHVAFFRIPRVDHSISQSVSQSLNQSSYAHPNSTHPGIARCFTFGGARGRPLYDPATLATGEVALPTSMEAYAGGGGGRKKQQQDTVAHFHEKLLHLKGRMRTAEGRRVAEARHVFMEAFLAQLWAEVNQEA